MIHNYQPVAIALIFIVLDILTGYLAAARNGNLNSTIMKEGLWSKLGEICSIVLGFIAEFAMSIYGSDFITFNCELPIASGVCAYITLYELTSIIENIGSLNKELGVWLVEHVGFDPNKVNLIKIDNVKEVSAENDK
jgi:phage-related holin